MKISDTNTKTVAVGLSGGVDSAVSAYLLKEQGYNVIAIYMQNWETDKDDPHCSAEQDLSDAKSVCDQLGIPLHTTNFAQEYWDNVFKHCLDEFSAGRTPNPDVLCNREIKFNVLLDYALSIGADYLATGHYAKKMHTNNSYQLCKAIDNNKDQSYFLYMIGQRALQHALFPLSDLEKPQVREIAQQQGFLNATKKDSTGICFIGERKFKDFLSEYMLAKPGVMQTPEGVVIGQHNGLMFHTIGQRKGLNIGGRQDAGDEPWYVLDKDIENNVLIVGQGHNHPLLFSNSLQCEQMNWISGAEPEMPLRCVAKTRYRQVDQACVLKQLDDDCYEVSFDEPQRAVTLGQSVVFYVNDVCLGGGIITVR